MTGSGGHCSHLEGHVGGGEAQLDFGGHVHSGLPHVTPSQQKPEILIFLEISPFQSINDEFKFFSTVT
jgi:hypothetical protein